MSSCQAARSSSEKISCPGCVSRVSALADPLAARKRLANLMERTPFPRLKAVKTGQVHAVWHQFYGVPYDFIPIQQFARWFHPDLFADLDPDKTFRDFHAKFLPITYRPGYFTTLEEGSN
jgi:iron complex transport system substrate-binding protein